MIKSVNFWGIGAAVLAWWMFGFVWYGVLFTEAWMSLEGLTEEMTKGKEWMMLLGIVQIAFVCFGLDWVRRAMKIEGALNALKTGLWLGMFFSVATIFQRFIYALEPLSLIGIDGSYQLIGFGMSMTILSVFKGFKKITKTA